MKTIIGISINFIDYINILFSSYKTDNNVIFGCLRNNLIFDKISTENISYLYYNAIEQNETVGYDYIIDMNIKTLEDFYKNFVKSTRSIIYKNNNNIFIKIIYDKCKNLIFRHKHYNMQICHSQIDDEYVIIPFYNVFEQKINIYSDIQEIYMFLGELRVNGILNKNIYLKSFIWMN